MKTSQQQVSSISECEDCFIEERSSLLHNIRHEGIYRRICSSCVLKLNSGSFCSICFQVFEDVSSIPIDKVVHCLKCSSIAHLDCVVQNNPDSFDCLYICPPCSIPNFSFLDINSSSSSHNCRRIDLKFAKVLVAAAFFASISMKKAAVATQKEVECRCEEAFIAKKRADQALDYLTIVSNQAKEEEEENEDEDEIIGVSVTAATLLPPPLPKNKKKISKTNGVVADKKGKAVLGNVGHIKMKRTVSGCSSIVAKSNSKKDVSV